MMTMLLVGAMVFAMAACGTKENNEPVGGDPSTWGPALEDETESVQIPQPNTEYTTLAEAEKAAGFDFTAPDTMEGFPEKVTSVYEMDVNMIEISYKNGDQAVHIRKETMTQESNHDISGVYIDFENTNTADKDGIAVTLKGNGAQVSVATWSTDEYDYSIYATEGMSTEEALALVGQIQ